jgi:predicted molibdopterin-dependent oxidoreductase YjgC
LRLHQDIVLNTSALLPGPAVLLLPAQTRYETPGGGTSTSTERRIRYSPEVEGPRIAEAWPEWRIPVAVALAVRPGLSGSFGWPDPAAIRREMAEAMPLYAGIEGLEREGQSVQWGGERLFADGFSKMPGGRARFSSVRLPSIDIPTGWFLMTTRRGKQFNSMSYGERDFLMGSSTRRDVLIHPEDAAELGVKEGDAIQLRSEVGIWEGITRPAPVKRRHVQVYWPESNVLIPRRFDPVSGEPDYNAMVVIEPLRSTPEAIPARIEDPEVGRPAREPAPALVRSRSERV